MRTRYGVSPWVHNVPSTRRPDYSRLRGDHRTDVVIVGGGLTGCAVAYACAVAGVKTVLVEADRIGQGSAGRSAGLLLPEPGPSFKDLTHAHGLRTARRIFEGWRRGALDAAAMLRRLKITCGLDARETLLFARHDEDKRLRREYDTRTAAGLDARWLTPKQVRHVTNLDASAGLALGDGFAFDPYRAAIGLAAAAVRRGALLAERSPAVTVRAATSHVEVTLDGAAVRADRVIVATGTATREFQPLRRHFKNKETYLVLTAPLPALVRKQVGGQDFVLADLASPPHLVRWTSDSRLLVGGADQEQTPERSRDAVLVQRTGQLMYTLLTMFPAISGLQPEFGWQCAYGETADGVMYIGPHRNYPRHLFALGGGASVTGACLAARLLVRALRDDVDKADEAFGWTR